MTPFSKCFIFLLFVVGRDSFLKGGVDILSDVTILTHMMVEGLDKRKTFRVSSQDWEAFEALARRSGLTSSALLRSLVKAAVRGDCEFIILWRKKHGESKKGEGREI